MGSFNLVCGRGVGQRTFDVQWRNMGCVEERERGWDVLDCSWVYDSWMLALSLRNMLVLDRCTIFVPRPSVSVLWVEHTSITKVRNTSPSYALVRSLGAWPHGGISWRMDGKREGLRRCGVACACGLLRSSRSTNMPPTMPPPTHHQSL